MDRGAFAIKLRIESHPQDPHGRRRKLIPKSCPLTSGFQPRQVCTHTHAHIHINIVIFYKFRINNSIIYINIIYEAGYGSAYLQYNPRPAWAM